MFLDKPIKATHNKTGKEYKILGFYRNCTNENEGQILVLYQSLTINNQIHYSRELGEFVVKFESESLSECVNEYLKNNE